MNMDYSKAFELLNQDAEKERNKKADVKQQLLDKLSKEPLMVISTAYVYAKNYVMYGEDITKAWTTAVQQASILEQVKIKAQTEAYDSFKKDYENRLKTEMAAMLDKIRAEIIKYEGNCRLAVDEYPSCKQCTDNVFNSIYGFFDKYRGVTGQ
jgi:preprotein translocase subunit SecD